MDIVTNIRLYFNRIFESYPRIDTSEMTFVIKRTVYNFHQ